MMMLSSGAFADTIVHFTLNDGFSDNFDFQISSPLISFYGSGTTPFDFYNASLTFAPGSTFFGETSLHLTTGFARISSTFYEVQYSPGQLFVSTFVFPTNGHDFRVPVELSFSEDGVLVGTDYTISPQGSVQGYMRFAFYNGAYIPIGGFEQAPEPGTIGLLGTGLIGVLAKFKKRRFRRPARL
jgi:hypothetical protein